MQAADSKAGQVKGALKDQAINAYMRGGQPQAIATGGDPARAGAYVTILPARPPTPSTRCGPSRST